MAQPKGRERERGILKQGDEGMKSALSLLQEFQNVAEVGFVRPTAYMWIVQRKKGEPNFKMVSKLVSYDKEIQGYVDKKRIEKLKVVKAKELMLWPPVNEIIVDDPPAGKLHFESLAGVTGTFPVEAFAAGSIG